MLRVKFIVFTILLMIGSLLGLSAQTDTISVPGVRQVVDAVTNIPQGVNHGGNNMEVFLSGLEDVLIPIVAIVTPFLMGFLIVFFVLRYQLNKKKAKYAVVQKALEMGKDLPAEFFQSPQKSQQTPLESALVVAAVGLGLVIMGIFITKILYGVGAICIFVGIAKFIAWKIEAEKNESSNNPINE